ncbi:TetR/AcrR family transcriptional regulator C-terminal ligand-binding domain-containing protein [Mycobacterium yunnanensis]|uniref:TetR/AcrR family transcriptional regulator C-terminal ligand-binding domain-containing protein n=1 Tax=Mycobacterium yunnanensis TaxID=368477 RepID=A0A9X3C0F3_9MYCO|nr:TetR-like C-terminal domain-containing protein [Mycobacterium yunnanensis]MCV7420623.1 TetR/AcrR family transcriptional regulator C-terminal ligand-binding domain-containing protein [Mycobacterium yunnanensis]
MSRATDSTGRKRPSGAFGPVRDEARDARIIDAVLDLIVESGYADLTMGAVAARAKVAKATVYRRWASREDLVADALESLMLPSVSFEGLAAETLREDLIATLTRSSACLQPQRRRFSAALAAATGSHPQIADTLRERYIAGQREAIASCLRHAQERGELTADRVERLLTPGRLEIAAAVGVLVLQEDLLGAILDVEGIAHLVDQVLLPLIGVTSNSSYVFGQ